MSRYTGLKDGLGLMKADLEIVDEVKNGHREAFALLVERHQRPLLRLCMRFVKDLDLAEDVVQEAFIKAYQKIQMFEARASFKSWLFQIAVNTAKNKLRAKRSDHISVDNVHLAVEGEAHSSLEKVDLKELIRAHVDELPERQRVALVLRIFEDLSFKEIAVIMKCPYDTAKANYRHAVMKLRHKFAEDKFLSDWENSDAHLFVKSRFSEADQ